MTDFYTRLLNGEPRGEAIRQPRLSMKKKHPQPRNWSGFICQGDIGKLARFG